MVRQRRLFLIAVNLLVLCLPALPVARYLFRGGWSFTGTLLFVLFVLLIAPVVYGFTIALTGWCLLWRGASTARMDLATSVKGTSTVLPATAIVMPIYNEDVGRVFQGLRVMYESLQRAGGGEAFDFFILSDTSDTNKWIAEERAWFELCKQVGGFNRIFYRKRRVTMHNKSGNVADFCRRWGARYRYMIVVDADSIMTGGALVGLANLMEANPRAGIIQTGPRFVLGTSLFQRVNQFAQRVGGPAFMTGANFWQQGSASYWGHNAIIRLEPFMKHCAMPDLPDTGPLGRHVLSHDTVEAAFMRQAGYQVWVAPNLEGSYEEAPPHLLASLQRDRRWCHGNLQHVWFLLAPGLKRASRFNILMGILAYVSSPLWLLFLLLGPFWFGHGEAPRFLFVGVMCLLLAPKALGATLILRDPEKRQASGGGAKIIGSVVVETVFSMILAPILMLFHTRFVFSSLTGGRVRWGGQNRSGEDGPSWGELFAVHLPQAVFAIAWGGLVYRYSPAMLPWLLPIVCGPVLAIPFSRLTGSTALGQRARERGWFLTPEETNPPLELQQVETPFAVPVVPLFESPEYAPQRGLLQVALDPYINAIHVSLLQQHPTVNIRTRNYVMTLAEQLLVDGPFALGPREMRVLLWDADAIQLIHDRLWSSPLTHLHEWWQTAFREYNESLAIAVRREISVF